MLGMRFSAMVFKLKGILSVSRYCLLLLVLSIYISEFYYGFDKSLCFIVLFCFYL